MPILDAMLAFALSMLVVASTVTALVSLMKNTATLRSKELKNLLTEFQNKEIAPVVDRELKRVSKTIQSDAAAKLNTIATQDTPSLLSKLIEEVGTNTLVSVSKQELIEHLKRSKLGHELLSELGDEAEKVFNNLGKQYEAIGERFTASFRTKSRQWSFTIGLVLALALNIDSLFLLKSYIQNENLRGGVVAEMNAIVATYEARVQAAADTSTAQTVTSTDLKDALNRTRDEINALRNSGLPIGWHYFPYACVRGTAETPSICARNTIAGWGMWLLGILLTAYLAGLGAPFWYDAVTGLSRLAQRARSTPQAESAE